MKISAEGRILIGGFSSLEKEQLNKIKGGIKDLESTNNFMCDNSGNCNGSSNLKNCV